MPIDLTFKAVVAWALILVLAVANGVLREAVLIPKVGAVPGLVLSGLLLSCLILATAYLFLPWFGTHKTSQLLLIGLVWLALTLFFEFSFGLLRGKPLSEILASYTFKGGNMWPVVIMMTALAPLLAARLRGWV